MDQQHARQAPIARPRHDGWTRERQVTFIITLRRTGNVSFAATAAGMSRESAYRLRARPAGAVFAEAWDAALSAGPGHNEGHDRRGRDRSRIGFPDREHHKGNTGGQTPRDDQFHQHRWPEARLSASQRAELLARIERAARG